MAEVCPVYFRVALLDSGWVSDAVDVATHAKVPLGPRSSRKDDSDQDGGPFDADVVLVDEAHQMAADVSLASTEVNPFEVADTLRKLSELTDGYGTKDEVQDRQTANRLAGVIDKWAYGADLVSIEVSELLTKMPPLEECKEAVTNLEELLHKLIEKDWPLSDPSHRPMSVSGALMDVKQFLVLLSQFKEGTVDFVHTRYESQGSQVTRLVFRGVHQTPDAVGCDAADVYEAWRTSGTHPAIDERWGGLLDDRIESYWEGLRIDPGGDREKPGAVARPLDILRDKIGAQLVCSFSATHNQVSDPSRPPDDLRETRHDLVVAEPNLRTSGSREGPHRSLSASPQTSWFRELVERAQEETGAQLAAVPVNSANADLWRDLPVVELAIRDETGEKESTHGLVPHSRGAVGSKDYESLDVDAVLCGLQAQSPAETARQLVEWWELLAPHRDNPEAVLADSWRLLGQHLVSGTIQAAGRFRPEATTVLFDLPELVELAGYEYELATPDMGGFVGAFVEQFNQEKKEHERRWAIDKARATVEWLHWTEGKSPTKNQFLSKYTQALGVTEQKAKSAMEAALEEEMVIYDDIFWLPSQLDQE